MAEFGVVASIRPGSSRVDDLHAWIDERRADGAASFLIVAVNGERGTVDLREFGEPLHGSVHATVAMIVQARAIQEFRPIFLDPDEKDR